MPATLVFSSALKNVCDMLLAFGAVMLAFGICMGFVKATDPPYVLVSLGISVALFATSLALLVKTKAYRIVDSGEIQPPPGPKVISVPESNVGPVSETTAMSTPEANAMSVPEAKSTAVLETKAMSVTSDKAEPKPEANRTLPMVTMIERPTVTKSTPNGPAGCDPAPPGNITHPPEPGASFGVTMNATLGEILLAAMRIDPAGTARTLAQAIAQPAAPIAAVQAAASQGELLPQSNTLIPATH
jgi:hypothetical protein